jgi:hypothetical protein
MVGRLRMKRRMKRGRIHMQLAAVEMHKAEPVGRQGLYFTDNDC